MGNTVTPLASLLSSIEDRWSKIDLSAHNPLECIRRGDADCMICYLEDLLAPEPHPRRGNLRNMLDGAMRMIERIEAR